MAKTLRVPASEARSSLPDLVQEVRRKGQRVKITRYGKTLACIVPAEDAALLDDCRDELEACAERKKASSG